jgi:hypothetical protein
MLADAQLAFRSLLVTLAIMKTFGSLLLLCVLLAPIAFLSNG